MKKLLLPLLVIVLIVVGLFIYRKNHLPADVPIVIEPPTATADIANSSFRFSDEGGTMELPLENGKNTDADNGVESTLSDTVAKGDLNGDGKGDEAGILIQESSGTGVFVYLIADVSGPVRYKGTNAVFLGDRISIESISIGPSATTQGEGQINVNYLDRKPDEPFAADPTVSVSKHFVLKNGDLVEN